MSQETSKLLFTLLKPRESHNNHVTVSSIELNVPAITVNGEDLVQEESDEREGISPPTKTNKLVGGLINDGEYLPEHLRDQFDYERLVCSPLEEVDSEFINRQTFLVVGKDWKVRRFSAQNSSFIFNPFSRLRRLGISILSNWQLPLLIGISLVLLSVSFILPNYASNSVATAVWNATRYIFGGLLLAEIFINALARGILVTEFTYLRSPWDWLDVTIFAIVFLNLYWKSLLLHSLEGVVLLKFIPIVPALKTGFQITTQILKNLVPVLVYSLLTLWILIIVGWHIQSHRMQIHNNKEAFTDINSTIISQCQHQIQFLHNPNTTTSNISEQLSTNNGNYKLPSLPSSANISHLEIITEEAGKDGLWDGNGNNSSMLNYNCSNRYYLASSLFNFTIETASLIIYKAFGGISKKVDDFENHFLYVTLTLICGTFGVSLLTASSVGSTLFVIGDDYHNVNAKNASSNKQRSFSNCLPGFLKCDNVGAFKFFRDIVFHPFFELLVTFVICADVVIILLRNVIIQPNDDSLDDQLWLQRVLTSGQEVCFAIYIIEFLLKIMFPSKYFRNWWPLLDSAVVGLLILNKINPVSSIFLSLRIIKIVPRWPTLELILQVVWRTVHARLSFICILALTLFAVGIGTETLLHGYGSPASRKLLSLAINQSFIFNYDWTLIFTHCNTKGLLPLCLASWISQLILGMLFISVMFVTVINVTCDLISRNTSLKCNSYNYENLCKAVNQVTGYFRRNCHPGQEQSSSQSQQQSSPSPTRRCNEISIPIPTTNGGLRIPIPQITINETEIPEDAEDNNRNNASNNDNDAHGERRNSLVSSILEIFNNCKTLSAHISIGIIVLSTILSVIKFDDLQRLSPIDNPRLYVDLIFVCYFLLISLWKLVKNNFKLLKSPPWLLDLLVVSATGFTLYVSVFSNVAVRDMPVAKVIITMSCLRGIMLLTRLQWLKVAIGALKSELRLLWRYFLVLLITWLSLNWFRAQISRTWFGENGIQNATLVAALGKISVNSGVLIIHITLSGVFIGVIMSELLRNELLAAFMTPAQCTIYKDKELSLHREKTLHIPAPKRGLCNQVTHYISLTHAFDITVITTIICDCLVITFSFLAESKNWKLIWEHQYPPFIIFMYACELSVKLFGWRNHYWRSAWNFYDTFVVLIGFIDLCFMKIQLGFITIEIIRFFRVLHVMRLPMFDKRAMRLFTFAFVRVLPCIGNLVILLSILLYSYLIIGIEHHITTSSSGINQNDGQDLLQTLNNVLVSLMSLPILGEGGSSFQIAQVPPCWTNYLGISLIAYIYSFLALNYFVIGTIFAIILCEVFKTLSQARFIVQAKRMKKLSLALDLENQGDHHRYPYKHTNGGFLSCDFGGPSDDPDSHATMLTPIEPEHPDDPDHPLGEKDKYPVRMTANGYILHVEALVTTV